MTTRLANWLFLAGFILVGAYYLYASVQLASTNPSVGFESIQFPIALGLILIALSIAELWHSSRARGPGDDERLHVPTAGKLAMTVILAGVYFLVWSATNRFYPTTAVFSFILIMMYQENRTLRSTGTAVAASVLFTVTLYLVFGLAFSIRLS
jgi:hypothetical protein